MPPLPADAAAAWAAGPETALAWAIEAARSGRDEREFFTRALAGLVGAALAPQGGDPTFQALVLRAQDPLVEDYVRLAAQATADARAVRTRIDAVAHPGKTRSMPAGTTRDALDALHRLALQGAWTKLRRAIASSPIGALDDPALERLERGSALQAHRGVQQYLALCRQRGPQAGSQAASAQGNAAAKLGAGAEQATLQVFTAIARELDATGHYLAVGSLRTPGGFPGAADKAKDEWDAAIVHLADDGSADILLLAEVKAAPAAATADFSRLLRGLQRLAHAEPGRRYVFQGSVGELHIRGESLRRLHPPQQQLPQQVIYCCSGAEGQPAMLSAATRAVLLAEPASVAFARHGDPAALGGVWDALTTAPRLRSALHQYQTATAVRAAMLHPDDLMAAVRAQRA